MQARVVSADRSEYRMALRQMALDSGIDVDAKRLERILIRYWAMTCYEQANIEGQRACIADCEKRLGRGFALEVAEEANRITDKAYENYDEPPMWIIDLCYALIA